MRLSTQDILKKVRKIEIKSRGLSNNIFAGEYHTRFKGRGMTFSEVRNYQYGDDTRTIDWNVTARYNQPFIKLYEEERELTVMLLIDVSGSTIFGTEDKFKREQIAEIAAVLAFSAIQNNDKVGVLFFSDKIERYIPAKKGKSHILRIIRELLSFEAKGKGTDVAVALKYLTNAQKRRCTTFVISDFVSPDFDKALSIANNKHDVVALQVYDHRETEIPNVGILKVKDAETGEYYWVNTANKKVREQYSEWWNNFQNNTIRLFKQKKVDFVNIRTDEDYVFALQNLFKQRAGK
ncbi:uncharacterized protein DUF58 [Balneicella halophila]|uniref:Uncharacterized protein DUF58 n=1 Tax=Balneicella halophila TaxID=1537566 RepID=A0A7L4URU5_BALHA|nr:DUF58 domain-containing protein [Balneicella halophila]PVX52505.1 uncharacterized protein DUF58 [Balneicella halophila]